MTNWPTPQVVIMQKGLWLWGTPPDQELTMCPQTQLLDPSMVLRGGTRPRSFQHTVSTALTTGGPRSEWVMAPPSSSLKECLFCLHGLVCSSCHVSWLKISQKYLGSRWENLQLFPDTLAGFGDRFAAGKEEKEGKGKWNEQKQRGVGNVWDGGYGGERKGRDGKRKKSSSLVCPSAQNSRFATGIVTYPQRQCANIVLFKCAMW